MHPTPEKYAELTEEDVKRFVVEEKWLARLEENVNDELDNIVFELNDQNKRACSKIRRAFAQYRARS